MRHSLAICGLAALAASVATLAPATVTPAEAGGWYRWDGYAAPRAPRRRYYRITPRGNGDNLRYYSSPRAYRSACSYGDCGCLRTMAVRTGNPHWWDKYQACSG